MPTGAIIPQKSPFFSRAMGADWNATLGKGSSWNLEQFSPRSFQNHICAIRNWPSTETERRFDQFQFFFPHHDWSWTVRIGGEADIHEPCRYAGHLP
jgi:hypothetical protein